MLMLLEHYVNIMKNVCSRESVPRATLTLRIDLFADLQRVRVGEVGVGGRDGQDQAVLFGDELQQHVSDHTHTEEKSRQCFNQVL